MNECQACGKDNLLLIGEIPLFCIDCLARTITWLAMMHEDIILTLVSSLDRRD